MVSGESWHSSQEFADRNQSKQYLTIHTVDDGKPVLDLPRHGCSTAM